MHAPAVVAIASTQHFLLLQTGYLLVYLLACPLDFSTYTYLYIKFYFLSLAKWNALQCHYWP